jgi:hypothetical protein
VLLVDHKTIWAFQYASKMEFRICGRYMDLFIHFDEVFLLLIYWVGSVSTDCIKLDEKEKSKKSEISPFYVKTVIVT